eukprot:TRINITY_DN3683_c0_g2_i4.p1 TRINITY_DN3683_c0_g2~~TRINITY_DN3683_c0_g2_i4.p1  ORF type:complete len:484 (-),score=138.78 TRINITY_DN3683_c0_g2_i4:74-1525(-)
MRDIEETPSEDPSVPKTHEQIRLEAFERLVKEVTQAVKIHTIEAIKLRESGDKHNALKIMKDLKEMKEVIVTLNRLKDTDSPLPVFSWSTSTLNVEVRNGDIGEDEMEVRIAKCSEIPSDVTHPYVLVTLPYPSTENPQKVRTAVFQPPEADIDLLHTFQIQRKKSFQIFLERKKITVELLNSRLLGWGDYSIGKAEMKLNPLLDDISLTQSLEFKDGRKVVGKVEVEVRLNRPGINTQRRDLTLRRIHLDSESEAASQKHPEAHSTPIPVEEDLPREPPLKKRITSLNEPPLNTPPSPVASTQSTVPQLMTPPSSKQHQPQPQQFGPSPSSRPVPPKGGPKTPTKPVQSPIAVKVESPIHRASPTPMAVDSSPNSSDFNMDDMISNDLLEWEISNLSKRPTDQLTEEESVRLVQLQMKKMALEAMVESGKLSMDDYLSRLRSKAEELRLRAKALVGQGDKKRAALELRRAKIIENEIQVSQE